MQADVDEIIRHTVDEMGVMWEQGKRAVAKINGQYKLMVEIVEDGCWPAMEATPGGQQARRRRRRRLIGAHSLWVVFFDSVA